MGDKRRILIVDDEPAIRDSLKLLLKNTFDIGLAHDGAHALNVVDEFKPDLVLLDVIMPNLDGMETLKQLRERHNKVPVVMLTATNTVKTAVQAMKYGAVDYLSKPFEIEELTGLIASTLDAKGQVLIDPIHVTPSRRALKELPGDFGPLVGKSRAMSDLFRTVEQVAERDTTVLITGESGTGKELIARQIHEVSPRNGQPFVAVNCAAIPETLIESELFGHERGAFTSAVERRIGLCEVADKGTLFLDEIGELSLPMQVKLLRFLQEQEFYRIGRAKPVKVDVRIIAATNRNLEEMIKEKQFRQDLFYRINVISVHIPPLRDRYEDIRFLAEHFCSRLSPLYGNRKIAFTEGAVDRLVQYPWPGNVRELENVIESLLALSPTDEIGEENLPRKMQETNTEFSRDAKVFSGSLKFEEAERIFETEMIVRALKKSNYVQTRAADLLGISRRILKYKMDKLGITDRPPEEEAAL